MFEIFCKCPKCGNGLSPDFDESVLSYFKDFEEVGIVVPKEDPPKMPNYMYMKCLNTKCKYKSRYKHEEILSMMTKHWAKIAWSYFLTSDSDKFNFEDHLTKYIMVEGLNKFVTKRDLDNNELIRDYVRYVESELIEESNN